MTIDLVGKRYDRLTVLSYHHTAKDKQRHWLCECECGNKKVVAGKNIKSGFTRSCGCLVVESALKNFRTHNLSNHPLYIKWRTLKTRCYNKKDRSYKHYGALGITICDEWKDSFENFYDWAINNGYEEGLTIKRKNVDGNYCPENCEWAAVKEKINFI